MENQLIFGALTKQEIIDRIDKDLFIRPILDSSKQLNEIGVDFRLGYNFLVNIQGREGFMNASLNADRVPSPRNMAYFFQETRRQIGETFILHPQQTVLATSLEYVKLPDNLFMMLFMRSSYSRLGLTMSTLVQPGYCGCLSIEMINNSFTPINLTVGARLIQALLIPTSSSTNYHTNVRKYMCQVRPEPSSAIDDDDLIRLNQLWKIDNNHV